MIRPRPATACRASRVDGRAPRVWAGRSLVHLDNGDVVIGEPKTAKGTRTVTLDGPSAEILALRREEAMAVAGFVGRKIGPGDYVFGGLEGKPLRPHSLSRAVARAAKEVKAPNTSFHGLRHLHATELLRAGIHPRVVQERLDHGDVTVTLNTYSHVVPGFQERAAETFDEAFAFTMPESRERRLIAASGAR